MTIAELVEAAPFCDSIEVVVREHGSGKWIQGYRIGKNVEMFKCEFTIEFQETIKKDGTADRWGKHKDGSEWSRMTDGEIRDVFHAINLPMKIIKKPVDHLPDNVAQLKVCDFQPRHIPSMHKEQMTHNDFTLDINAYPEGWEPERLITKTEQKNTKSENLTGWEHLDGQISIFDLEEQSE